MQRSWGPVRSAPRRVAAALLLSLVVSILAGPGAALAANTNTKTIPTPLPPGGTSPFSPGVPAQTGAAPSTSTATTPAVVTTSSSGGGSVSTTDTLFIGVGAVLLICGIAYFIWRDARGHAPASAGTTSAPGGRARSGSKPPPKPRKLSAAERRRRKRGRAR